MSDKPNIGPKIRARRDCFHMNDMEQTARNLANMESGNTFESAGTVYDLDFWTCGCGTVHHIDCETCPNCGAVQDEWPNSEASEVYRQNAKHKHNMGGFAE
jgi:rubrerythrin